MVAFEFIDKIGVLPLAVYFTFLEIDMKSKVEIGC